MLINVPYLIFSIWNIHSKEGNYTFLFAVSLLGLFCYCSYLEEIEGEFVGLYLTDGGKNDNLVRKKNKDKGCWYQLAEIKTNGVFDPKPDLDNASVGSVFYNIYYVESIAIELRLVYLAQFFCAQIAFAYSNNYKSLK